MKEIPLDNDNINMEKIKFKVFPFYSIVPVLYFICAGYM